MANIALTAWQTVALAETIVRAMFLAAWVANPHQTVHHAKTEIASDDNDKTLAIWQVHRFHMRSQEEIRERFYRRFSMPLSLNRI